MQSLYFKKFMQRRMWFGRVVQILDSGQDQETAGLNPDSGSNLLGDGGRGV